MPARVTLLVPSRSDGITGVFAGLGSTLVSLGPTVGWARGNKTCIPGFQPHLGNMPSARLCGAWKLRQFLGLAVSDFRDSGFEGIDAQALLESSGRGRESTFSEFPGPLCSHLFNAGRRDSRVPSSAQHI